MKPWTVSASVVLFFLVSACATTPVPVGERANPVMQTLENASYRIAFEPKKTGGNFFRIFALTVQNKGSGDIEIDWNRTRYLYEGEEAAGFVFEGITPADVSAGSIPPDVVPGGGTYFREIAPHRLIAFAPIRDKSVAPGESGISAGPLPGGRNGISLALKKDGKLTRETLEVSIEVLY